MPTQVRIFAMPKSLGETLNGSSLASIPRSMPDQISEDPTNLRSDSQRYTMTTISETPKEGGITFSGQDQLPKLPIPELENTCKKYLAALKPLQSPREHAETRAAVQEFLKHDGPHLQEKLRNYAVGKTSYIEQFCKLRARPSPIPRGSVISANMRQGYDSYLNFDNPVVLNLNPFFLLEDDPTPARNNQVTRAASLVASALEFVRAVRREELPPDTVKGKPLDMYQYSRLFGTARVPTDHGCQIEQDPDSKHIVVLCHGQVYWFDVLDDNSDVIMCEKDLAVNLQTIIDDASQTPIQEAAKGALGVLSTENRKVWSGLRDLLTKEEGSNNAECLGIVDSALFVLCLDYTEPKSVAELCQNMLCGTNEVEKGVQIGTCINRWYDKLQIIVCKNGSAGINFEHTGVDGHTVLRFASDLYTDTILRFARTINGKSPSLWKTTSPDPSKRDPESFGDVNIHPYKLEWDMIPELNIAVRFAEARLADLIGQNEFECLDFSGFGKNFITSAGFSPDAFVQMAFQAAYYGLYGRIDCTYEPAMTKIFLHGRTEAIRSVTEESVQFVQTFWADNPPEEKVEALRRACQKHTQNTRESAKAEGCDRHLYALFCVWQKLLDDDQGSSTGYSSPTESTSERGGSLIGSPGRDSILSSSLDGGDTSTATTRSRRRGDSTTSRSRDGGHPVPLIFADGGWDKLNNTILSTSNCGNPCLRQFGFGPTSADGFGIGYIIKDDSISLCASSKHRQTKRFIDTLEAYLLEIRRVLRITNQRSATTKQSRAREIESSSTASLSLPGDYKHKLRTSAPPAKGLKARGRMITGGGGGSGSQNSYAREVGATARSSLGSRSPTEESLGLSEDEELGGYGFFDSGMLLQALKARGRHDNGDSKGSERSVRARRKDIGKKLRLVEY